MKKLILIMFCAMLSLAAVAQHNRLVKGYVMNEEGESLSGVTIKAVNSESSTVTDKDGYFEIKVSVYTKYVEASCSDYITDRAKIDGFYITFKLKNRKQMPEIEEYYNRAAEEIAAAAAKAEAKKKKAEAAAKREAEKKAAAKAKAEDHYNRALEEITKAAAKAETDAKRSAEENVNTK